MAMFKILYKDGDRFASAVELDGRHIDVTDVKIHAIAGKPPAVDLKLFSGEGFHFNAESVVKVEIVALPGYRVVRDGHTYRAEKDE